ncbi:hypothetical protein F8O01_13660 [Pseudoclavibacter chungangensis]|uniref:Uncharacterized protein n=1 Tax=Pseudoclavibacter chungangensis TaxID=587635 RepID=A0A7J5BNW5_9MICO|nr:hypothetical protein [Pseudoclavibacter chungangensis]KAB1654278.1 hypothetical protein F8O01_13660 [Pseudoclavibacter chungangensis]NYJ65317.1 hypothetical protein [Pseudoclavibacter chungangensis]
MESLQRNATTPPARTAHDASVRHPAGDILLTLTQNLGRKVVAHALNVDERTIRRWIEKAEFRLADGPERALRSLFLCYSTIAGVDDGHVARAWFIGMNPNLDDETPVDEFRAGHERDVLSAARAYAEHA